MTTSKQEWAGTTTNCCRGKTTNSFESFYLWWRCEVGEQVFVCRKCRDTMTEADREFWSQMAAKTPGLKSRQECPVCYQEQTILGKVVAICQLKRRLPQAYRGSLNVGDVYSQAELSLLTLRMTPEG